MGARVLRTGPGSEAGRSAVNSAALNRQIDQGRRIGITTRMTGRTSATRQHPEDRADPVGAQEAKQGDQCDRQDRQARTRHGHVHRRMVSGRSHAGDSSGTVANRPDHGRGVMVGGEPHHGGLGHAGASSSVHACRTMAAQAVHAEQAGENDEQASQPQGRARRTLLGMDAHRGQRRDRRHTPPRDSVLP